MLVIQGLDDQPPPEGNADVGVPILNIGTPVNIVYFHLLYITIKCLIFRLNCNDRRNTKVIQLNFFIILPPPAAAFLLLILYLDSKPPKVIREHHRYNHE